MAILADAPDNSPRDRNSRAKILPAERAALVAAVQSKLDAARDFIRNYLADEHWHPRADLFDLAREWGPRFADRTLRRALESLQDDGEVEQCSRKRVTHLALALRRHQSGNSQQPGLQYYRPDDVAGPRSDLHKRGAAHFGRTADRFLDPEEIVPDYWARHLDDGIWSTNHDFDRREKEKLCLQIVDAYRMKSSKLRFADRRYQSIGEEVCAVIKVGPVVTAIREQSEGREHLYYNEIILPRIHGGERRRWRVALAQTEKRTRDAVAAADPNDAWGGCHAFLGTRPGTGRWRTEILGLLTTHPHPIPDGADQRGWERLPRDEALTLAAKEVLLHGVMSAQPTPGRLLQGPPLQGRRQAGPPHRVIGRVPDLPSPSQGREGGEGGSHRRVRRGLGAVRLGRSSPDRPLHHRAVPGRRGRGQAGGCSRGRRRPRRGAGRRRRQLDRSLPSSTRSPYASIMSTILGTTNTDTVGVLEDALRLHDDAVLLQLERIDAAVRLIWPMVEAGQIAVMNAYRYLSQARTALLAEVAD